MIQSHGARLAISDAQCQRTSNRDAYYRFSMGTSLQEWSDLCHGGIWSSYYERLPYQWHIPRVESTARNAIYPSLEVEAGMAYKIAFGKLPMALRYIRVP